MRTLEERLDSMRAAAAKKFPEEVRAVMSRATQDLRDSGIMDRIARPGDALPAFELKDTEGSVVRSADLLGQGPLVVTVYRGSW